jgi:hypothetical protein
LATKRQVAKFFEIRVIQEVLEEYLNLLSAYHVLLSQQPAECCHFIDPKVFLSVAMLPREKKFFISS